MISIPTSLCNGFHLTAELSTLSALKDSILFASNSEPDLVTFIPTHCENMSEPRHELLTICKCMQNNPDPYISRLCSKYIKLAHLTFLKFNRKLPCKIHGGANVLDGNIIGVNQNKEFAIEAADQRFVVKLTLPHAHVGGKQFDISDTTGLATSSATGKSKNMIQSNGGSNVDGYAGGSSENYFSESTSGAEEGLCE